MLKFNAHQTESARIITHDSRETLVVPVVAVVEGVLNGMMLNADEFSRFVDAWEGIPVPVNHPQMNGQHVSSNKPEILEKRVIGRFHNVQVDNKKLKGEIWIDVNAAKRKGFDNIVENLRGGEVMEVSTAYFADIEEQSGIHNGKTYSGIQRNLRPDHLALLPNEEGACSVADGCGTYRNHKQCEGNMDKKEKVQAIIANSKFFADGDEERLLAFDDSVLEGLYQANASDDKDEDKRKMKNEEDEDEEQRQEPAANTQQPAPVQLDQESLLAVNWAKQQYSAEKNRLIGRLTANCQCAFSKNDLDKMHVDDLEKLDKSINTNADYSGQGLPVTNASKTEEPLEAPKVVLAAIDGGAK